jgi:hypothetical protein
MPRGPVKSELHSDMILLLVFSPVQHKGILAQAADAACVDCYHQDSSMVVLECDAALSHGDWFLYAIANS